MIRGRERSGSTGMLELWKKRRDGGGEMSGVLGKVENEIRFQRSKKTPNSPVNKVGEESGVMEVLKTRWRG